MVLSEDVRNRVSDDVIVVPLFSAGRLGPTRVQLPAGAGGLRRSGVLFCEELSAIHHQFLHRGPLGPRLSGPLLDAVVRAVMRAIGEVIPEP